MAPVKRNIKTNNTNNTKKIKAVLLSSAVGMAITSVLLFVLAFIMTKIDFPQKTVFPLALICSIVGLFLAGFICCKFLKSGGLLYGLLCGVIIYAFSFICELAIFNREITVVALYKLIIYIVSSMIGGVVAVNFNQNPLKTKKYR